MDTVWGWYFKFDFPFFGAGLMTPGNTVITFFIAELVVYGIIGPLLVQNGTFVAPLGFTARGDTTNRFFLWPGIALMALSAFTELFIHYDSLWRGVKGGVKELKYGVMRGVQFFRRIVLRSSISNEQQEKYASKDDEKFVKDAEDCKSRGNSKVFLVSLTLSIYIFADFTRELWGGECNIQIVCERSPI